MQKPLSAKKITGARAVEQSDVGDDCLLTKTEPHVHWPDGDSVLLAKIGAGLLRSLIIQLAATETTDYGSILGPEPTNFFQGGRGRRTHFPKNFQPSG